MKKSKRKSLIKFLILATLVSAMAYLSAFTPSVAYVGHNVDDRVEFDVGHITIIHENDEKKVVSKRSRKFDDIIQRYSEKYGVSFELISQIIDCENVSRDTLLQSRIRYTKKQIAKHKDWGNVGDREKSFGLVQIHIPAKNYFKGKLITKEMAQDPEFSIQFLAFHLSKGHGSMWATCYEKSNQK